MHFFLVALSKRYIHDSFTIRCIFHPLHSETYLHATAFTVRCIAKCVHGTCIDVHVIMCASHTHTVSHTALSNFVILMHSDAFCGDCILRGVHTHAYTCLLSSAAFWRLCAFDVWCIGMHSRAFNKRHATAVNAQECTRMHKNARECTRMHENALECTRMHMSIMQSHAVKCMQMRRHAVK